eukprot:5430317-Pleurochrysis_carterae.AAC.7
MFAFIAREANHSLESVSATLAKGLNFPGKIPNKVEQKQFIEQTVSKMLWTKSPTERCFKANIPTPRCSWRLETWTTFRQTRIRLRDWELATRAALLRAQVKHENMLKQEPKEALLRDYSNRIAFTLALTRPKAGLKLRTLQNKHALPMYRSMYDGEQMFKELKDELINLHDAYDADQQ